MSDRALTPATRRALTPSTERLRVHNRSSCYCNVDGNSTYPQKAL